MEPFRELLKTSNSVVAKVHWDERLQEVFETSKEILVEPAEKGLQYFDPNRETILMTDWSKSNQGIGFVLLHVVTNGSWFYVTVEHVKVLNRIMLR